MWYVVQVVGGRERRVLHLVEQLVDDDAAGVFHPSTRS